MPEKVSIREFARRVGVSDTYVKKNYQSTTNPNGCITPDCLTSNDNNGRPMLWWRQTAIKWIESGIGDGRVDASVIDQYPDPGAGPVAPPSNPIQEPSSSAPQPNTIAGNTQQADQTVLIAKRQNAVYSSLIKKTEYERMVGKLVEKENVFSELFEFGQQLKEGLLQIPDRVVSDMRIADTDKQAYNILMSELERVILQLTDGPKTDFS